jgi:cyanate permease
LFTQVIFEKPQKEQEIEALSGLAVNAGYIIGPVSAGFLADKLGNLESFTVLGIVGVVATLLLISSRKHHV